MSEIDKAVYAEQKRQEKQEYNQTVAQALSAMAADPEKLRIYLEVQGRLPAYSVGNAVMVAVQYPAARHVKLSTEWSDMNVKPLRGVKGIAILVPGKPYKRQDGTVAQGYDVRRAFDISQTTAAAHENAMPRPANTTLLRGLLDYQKGAWLFQTADEGEPARYFPEQQTIVIRKNQQFSSLFPALAKEVVCAELLLLKGLQREKAEPMACCITWMLCSHYQIDPVGIALPSPEAVMGTDSQAYRERLSDLVTPLRSLVNFMDKCISKAEKEREAAL